MQHSYIRRGLHAAFTLVEMAIVLAIIGLIIGAVFAGTSVLKQSELQTVIADYSKYASAAAQFNQLYGGQPGDLLDATNYWGDDNANCPDGAVTNGTPGTCNGDGNNLISGTATPAIAESVRAWQHLQLAKLVDGNFSGTGAGVALGTNVPRSRVTNAGWTFFNNTALTGSTNWYNQDLNNLLMFGAPATLSGLTVTAGPAITASEAWQVDKKADDSLPASGRILALKPSPSTVAPNCTTSVTDASAAYNITNGGTTCSLMMSLTTK